MNRSRRLRRVLLAAAATALLLTTATALAGSGVGGVFNLGQTNAVNAQSTLSGETAAPQLTLKNTSPNTSATALSLVVAAGRTPFKVSSPVKVSNLNADLVDGRDSTFFLAKTAKAADADKLDGQDSSAFLGAGAKAADAEMLDGTDSAGFWKAAGNAGTNPGTDFLGTSDNQALELKVNGQRALRIEPDATSPNVIGGYAGNSVEAGVAGAVIGGGGFADFENTITGGGLETISGGADNQATGFFSAVIGGTANSAGADGAVVGGGSNVASGPWSVIPGGSSNSTTSNYSTVAGGVQNTAGGIGAAVPGGYLNTASGLESFAAGTQAKATHDGSFVWGDNTFTDVASPADNTFTVRASGGIWLGTTSSPSIPANHFLETSTGGYLSTAGIWTNASDRALKHRFRPLNTSSVLEKVAAMPITSWSYKAELPSVRHIGPMAQDFYKSFGLGLDDKHIGTIDEGGVALAAIQGLYNKNRALERDNAELRRSNEGLRRQNAAQNRRLARLERALAALSGDGR